MESNNKNDKAEQEGAAVSSSAHSEQPTEQQEQVGGALGSVTQNIREEVSGLAQDLQASARAAASGAAHSLQEEVKAKREQTSQSARSATANVIHAAAKAVRHRSALPEAAVIDNSAEWLDEAAAYIDERDLAQIRVDFEKRVREAPLLAVLVALTTGLLLGSLIGRD